MAFVEEEDASGLQPYQRLERIHHDYEVLAAKKRTALPCHTSETPAKRFRQEEFLGASFEEIMETISYSMRRKSRKPKQRGRRKGSKNKVNPEVTQKLGDATLHYAHGRFDEAIGVLNEVIRLAPNLSEPYHTLGLTYNAMNDRKRALNFYMIAAHLSPRDASLWKLLVTWSIEQGDKKQANYCLGKAIKQIPKILTFGFIVLRSLLSSESIKKLLIHMSKSHALIPIMLKCLQKLHSCIINVGSMSELSVFWRTISGVTLAILQV